MKKKLYIYLAAAGVLGIVLAIMMINCFLNHVVLESFGSSSQLALVDSDPSVTVFSVVCFISVVLITVLPLFTIPKFDISGSSNNNVCIIFSTSLLGFLFAGYVINFIISYFRENLSFVQLPSADLSSAAPLIKVIFYAGIIAAVPCAIYFLLLAIQNDFKPQPKFCILSVCPVIWLALRIVYYFISTSARVNIAGRKLYIISLCFALFFFLQDCKRWVDYSRVTRSSKDAVRHSRLYFAAGFGAIVTLAATHISMTYLQAFWLLKPQDSYFLNGILISMVLFIAFRLASVPDREIA